MSQPVFVSTILDSYIAEVADLVELGQRKPRTLALYRLIREECFSEIEGRFAAELTPLELRRWVHQVARQAASSPRGTDGAATANVALRLLRAAYKEAEALGLVERGTSPAKYVRTFRVPPRARWLTVAELQRLWTVLESEHDRRRLKGIPTTPIEALRLIVLTGQRHGEIIGLRWRDVDLGEGVLRFETTKTGPREVPLSEMASEVLVRQRRATGGGEWVFPSGHRVGPLKSLDHCWRKVRRLAGFGRDVVIHTLRHSLAVNAQRQEHEIERISEALGHTSTATTRAIYCRPIATPGARAVMESHARLVAG